MVVVIAGACAKAATEPTAEPPHEHPPPPLGDELQDANCEYVARCRPAWMPQYPGGDLDGCRRVRACFGSFVAPRPQDAAVCMDLLRNAPCDEVEALLPVPATGLAGLTQSTARDDSPCAPPPLTELSPTTGQGTETLPATGEPCWDAGETNCQEDSWCRLRVPAVLVGHNACGTCTPYLQSGDACNDDVRCGSGTSCLDGLCQDRLPTGEPCDVDARCQSYNCENGLCTDRSVEQPSLPEPPRSRLGEACSVSCSPDPYTVCIDEACMPIPDVGDKCSYSDQCKYGLGCDHGYCEWIPSCGGIEPPGFCGGASMCAPGAYCDETDHCKAMPVLGQPCDENAIAFGALDRRGFFFFGTSCGDGSYCNPTTERCEPTLPNGSPCKDDAQCNSGWCERDFTDQCETTPTSVDCGGVIRRCDANCGVCQDYLGRAACP
jgi:hypothetical protein